MGVGPVNAGLPETSYGLRVENSTPFFKTRNPQHATRNF
jgi:hypothetical protein